MGIQGRAAQRRRAGDPLAGCDLAYSVTEAGSTSQRNLERAGLVAVYSQAVLIKSFA
ncbi:hypothetical protein WMF28_41210 [Sorangium sp. So ce590]|uniref:hypothetical protein n=1 Tax=Sorangium sp. So ce590 TaxID=3133317 RepID=UPI003F625384